MSLNPKIKVCIGSNCNKINLYEQTGINNPNNTTGWGGNNIDTDDILNSEVVINRHNNNNVSETIILKNSTIDVYTPVVGSPTPGPFLAIKNREFLKGNGVYKVKYEITTVNNSVYFSNCHFLSICGIEKCLQSLKNKILHECNHEDLKEIKAQIDQLEVIVYGIKSSFSCKDFGTVDELIKNAKIICDNLCNCGCGGC